ncbi:MAG: mechanosensitive ion channel [bacterium]
MCSAIPLKTMGTVFVAWGVFVLVDAVTAYLSELAAGTENVLDDHLVPMLKRVLRIAVIGVTIITVIQQWGYDVTSLIAGLGIGGLAFALAAQSTLSNWFGSFMIITDRPFLVGDYVRSAHGEGVVQDVGMRSTKILSFEGTTITIPNSDLATTAVENLTMTNTMNVKLD